MGYPTPAARTKNWGTELLTDTDLEGQLDLIIDWINDAQDKSSGHKHDGTTSEGPKIGTLAATVTSSTIFSGSNTFSGATSFTDAPTTTTDAPTTDAELANKKYVDDQVDGVGDVAYSTGFGSWVSKTNNTDYLAETDGFVCGTGTTGDNAWVCTDSASTPTIKRVRMHNDTNAHGVTCPVKKGDYWRAEGMDTYLYWIPLS